MSRLDEKCSKGKLTWRDVVIIAFMAAWMIWLITIAPGQTPTPSPTPADRPMILLANTQVDAWRIDPKTGISSTGNWTFNGVTSLLGGYLIPGPANRIAVFDATGALVGSADGFYDDVNDILILGVAGSGMISVPGVGLNSEQFGLFSLAGGERGTAVGSFADVAGNDAVGVGDSVLVPFDFSVGVGAGATAGGEQATVVGASAFALDFGSSFGFGANAAFDAFAGGHSADASGDEAIGIGISVTVPGVSNIGIGAYASVSGISAIGIGAHSNVIGNGTTVVGHNTTGSGNRAVVVGQSAQATGIGSTVVGSSGKANFQASLALGSRTETTATNQIVIGEDTGGESHYFNAFLGGGVLSPTASTYNFTVNPTGGSGTNIHAADMRIAGGRGTGNAAGGDAILAVAPPGASGTTLNPLTNVLTVSGADGSVNIGAFDVVVNGDETYDSTTQSWGFSDYVAIGIPPLPGGEPGDFLALDSTNNFVWDASSPHIRVDKNIGGSHFKITGEPGDVTIFNGFNQAINMEFRDTSGLLMNLDATEQRVAVNDMFNTSKENVTLVNDIATITSSYVRIAAETGLTDELRTINRATGTNQEGDLLAIETSADTLTIKNGVGNIICDAQSDKVITNQNDQIMFLFNGSFWIQRSPQAIANAQSALARSQFQFIGSGAGPNATTTVIVGPTIGEKFTSVGDELFFSWTFPSDLSRTVDPTLELSFYMTEAHTPPPNRLVSFTVDILVETPTATMSATTGTINFTDVAIPTTINRNFVTFQNLSAATFFPDAATGWHVKVKRATSSSEPTVNNDPVMHHGRIEYRRAR